MKPIHKLLVANRSEIAIRIMRAANELGIATVAIYAQEDRLSLHRFKSDEAYTVGRGLGPVKAYLDVDSIIAIARLAGVDAVHPGYGFLSEKPDFAEKVIAAGLTWVGPPPAVMRALGNKISARAVAERAGVPVMPATGPLPEDAKTIRRLAKDVGYPLMLKASWGGGGRGMRIIEDVAAVAREVDAGRREAVAAFGNGEVYLEKLVVNARHVEVQLLGDAHGNIVHLFERDCSMQRRNQKVVERAPAPYLDSATRSELCEAALDLARGAGYCNAGTAEFLIDVDSGKFYFIEVNPRIQVEHTVTEEVTGIDIVKAQIRIAEGARIGDVDAGVPAQDNIYLNGHALQCRITTEDPESNFMPDYGRITAYRGATGFGIRLDGGTAYSGAVITRFYDSLLEKVTAWAPTAPEAVARMDRAIREFRIRGVATNLAFIENLINHPRFRSGDYTTRFIDETPELFHFLKRSDRATRLLHYIANVTVNGHPDVRGRATPAVRPAPTPPDTHNDAPPDGSRQLLEKLGPQGLANWMLDHKRVLVTDTAMRDAHQSLLATRMRSFDMTAIADAYARDMSGLFSLECWGGATFDVAMRFLKECPWERLTELRARIPNILLQMLFRGSNGVGYTNYPDNVVRAFVHQAAASGIDVFRIFDCLNWTDQMRVAIDAVCEQDKLCEAVVCYTGDMHDPKRSKYDLNYYVERAKELAAAGTHVLGIKDMAGVCKPRAARELVRILKEETGLPIHFHTHDTSGASVASVLAAIEGGVDAVDAAMDPLSGLTSQPNLGAIVASLAGSERDTGLDPERIRAFSDYWELVRGQYAAFESDLRFGASEVYLHEMPGGQFTNLKEQARSLGLDARWHEVARAYADVNMMFGDIVKVTPSSKVVGDMALAMVSAGLIREDIEDPDREVAFPESVIAYFRGELGQPYGGFPKALQKKILKNESPVQGRPGATLRPVDFVRERESIEERVGRGISDEELQSSLMYPAVFSDYVSHRQEFGPVSVLPTPVFFYGMTPGRETVVDLEPGKRLVISCQAIGEPDEKGQVRVFFELNGQPRIIKVADDESTKDVPIHPKAEDENPHHIGAPMPGVVGSVAVTEGQKINVGDLLLTLEAMKMEVAIYTERPGTIVRLLAKVGSQVDAKDLLVELQDN